jgi:hypothetical protein
MMASVSSTPIAASASIRSRRRFMGDVIVAPAEAGAAGGMVLAPSPTPPAFAGVTEIFNG